MSKDVAGQRFGRLTALETLRLVDGTSVTRLETFREKRLKNN